MMGTADRYRAAGVDLDAADAAKRRILTALERTRTPLALGRPGAFGGMIRVPADVPNPVLVMSTDGVGTKVLVAIRAGRHDTVGEDLVNHCVNDILVHGARPIAFLDYIAAATIDADTTAALVEGVARGCEQHAMTLVGGETAAMPDLYPAGHYDLAGTIVGVVSEQHARHGTDVEVGDVLIGYEATGLHTNGYTLARQIVFDELGLDVDSDVPAIGMTVADALLAVHKSYVAAVLPVAERCHGLAHITGGGIPGNLVRSLPDGCGALVHTDAWPTPEVFQWLQDSGNVTSEEMYRVFNMGVGFIVIAAPGEADAIRAVAEHAGVGTFLMGEVVAGAEVRLV
jgi:phosphoribosylformylglycinamidine cyclo-ligase